LPHDAGGGRGDGAHAIPRCRLVVVEGSNHYTVLLGGLPQVRKEVEAFLAA